MQAQDVGVSAASAAVGEACGVSRQYVTGWRNGKPVPPKHWPTVARVTGIPVEVWETWELLGPAEAEAAPASEEQPIAARPLGSTREELDATVQAIDATLQGPGVTPAQRASLLKGRTSAIVAKARLEERQAIHEHPDFPPLVEDLVAAVRAALGPDAPDGLESRIADELERLQVARAATAVGRAA